jgi:hypothetical protein
MSDAFAYRPKFVDIRVSKSGKKKPGAAEKVERESSVRPCDHMGCPAPGDHRAPKGRDRANEYWYFCLNHVSDYNRRWNYFSGMSASEYAEYQAREEVGHRPTWTFRAGKGDRVAASARDFQPGKKGADPFAIFGGPEVEDASKVRPRRRLTRLQTLALEALLLDSEAGGAQIRARYAELVKRWHPDSNGGDRSAEDNLRRVVQAYQVLKAGGLV